VKPLQLDKTRKLKAVSLLELIVSMAIVALLIIMINGVILNLASASRKALARSFIREEIAGVMDRIVSDIRNADRVNTCSGDLSSGNTLCEVHLSEAKIWEICDNDAGREVICQKNASGEVIFESSPSMTIEQFSFEEGLSAELNFTRRNILITIVGSHRNPDVEVSNLVTQTIVSTRNYVLNL
jgi:hypothetical protein